MSPVRRQENLEESMPALHMNDRIGSKLSYNHVGFRTTKTMNNAQTNTREFPLLDLRTTLDWLSSPPAMQAEDDLAPLHAHLTALHNAAGARWQRHKILDLLYSRARHTIQRLLPTLVGASLPLARDIRQTVRSMQSILLLLAEDHFSLVDDVPATEPELLPVGRILWHAIDALAQHQLISSHVAAPYSPGTWKLANRAYHLALAGNHTETPIPGLDSTIEDIYLQACLLACAQPASFTSREISFAVDYIERFSSRAFFIPHAKAADAEGVFWIHPERDAPPTSFSRKPAPEGALCFACEQLAQLAEEQVDALEAGASITDLDLPEAAISPAGHGVLRRLAQHWGHPGKRRFPRRRQNFRAELSVGFESLHQLFGRQQQTHETTHWLVTNESADGYAVMHASGKTGQLTAGNIVAIRTEQNANWQPCIIRWVLSDNPEHLELGLQILSTQAFPATLVTSGSGAQEDRREVLILPSLPPIRPHEMLVIPTGAAVTPGEKMVLICERDNIEIREIRMMRQAEQTASLRVIAFENDQSP